MTREQLHQYFPDTYQFFKGVSDTHPFWQLVHHIHIEEMKQGHTLLPDIEQVFSSLHLVDGHHVLQDHLENVEEADELLDILTKLYIAYLYRNHNCRVVHDKDHGYDIELEIADELLALGVVQFRNLRAVKEQFAQEIESEIDHLESLRKPGKASSSDKKKKTESFIERLKKHATRLKDHPKAKHQVLAAITDHSELKKEVNLAQRVQGDPKEMERHFPHIAGVVLIDPTPGTEKAKFIPFHGDHDLEMLLNKFL